jgi:membrane protein
MSIVSDVISLGRSIADASSGWEPGGSDMVEFEETRPRRRLPLMGAAIAAAVAGGVGFVLGVVNAPRLADFEAEPGERGKEHERNPAKALDPSRGRLADSPTQIPARGWKDIAWRVYKEIQSDRVPAIAAGVTFYTLLALFPAVAALVAIYGLFTDPMSITAEFERAKGILPYGAADIIGGQLQAVAAKDSSTLGITFGVSLLLSLWSANSGTKALLDALNVAYGEEEKRSFIKLNAVSLAMTLGGLVFVVVALGAFVALPVILNYVPLGPLAAWGISIGRWVLMTGLLALALAVLYRFGPSRAEPKWRWISVGSVMAAVLWGVASGALSLYASHFANYDKTYGSLGGVIGFMFWIWVSVIVILAGAEVNAEIEHQTAKDSTASPPKPRGSRGAAMADTIGEAA